MMNQGSTRNEEENGCKDDGDDTERPAYKREDELRAAYERNDSVKAASEEFDGVSYYTVRNWLIEYGIHSPQRRESYSTAAKLQEQARSGELTDESLEAADGGA